MTRQARKACVQWFISNNSADEMVLGRDTGAKLRQGEEYVGGEHFVCF